ncbi:amino acid ABC transporter substrate-binding protein, PAAT family [Andreprevotia lacus DSM 23236]|uniref:Amino acid ABC transporter substrate-binding protein, PAAT family n=2 Tax=Andreprevotia TaxID=397275 RepID=A0A1W1XST3_9NEIS|nr:amino acid ABC transporter substrate-binding protein, PAAT family [Andreprevotia lacus DSM 23236]
MGTRQHLGAALGFCVCAQLACALTFVTEDYPPFNMQVDGEVSGIATELLAQALQRAGLQASFELMPWARALFLARSQPDTCVYSAVRTAERERFYRWIGPLVADEIKLFARADNPLRLNSAADASKFRVGGYNGDAYSDLAEKMGIPLERAASDVQNLLKLRAGRIDLWVAGSRVGPYRARLAGFQNGIKPVLTLASGKDTQMWLACNPQLGGATFDRLNAAVQAVLKAGELERISARYR